MKKKKKKTDLDKNIFSEDYQEAKNKQQHPIFLNEIYKRYLELRQEGVTPEFDIIDVGNILLENRKENKKAIVPVEWHHQGTTLYANQVFFSDEGESKDKALERIMKLLNHREKEKKENKIILKKSEANLVKNFNKQIEDIFKAANNNRKYELTKKLTNVIEQYVENVDYLVIVDVLHTKPTNKKKYK